MINAAQPHRVDSYFGPVLAYDGHHFEEIARPVGSKVKGFAVALVGDDERVLNRVHDVVIIDTVLAGRPVDLHVGNIVSRNYHRCGHRPGGL